MKSVLNRYKATRTGLIITVVGLLLHYTFIIPMLIVMPPAIAVELIAKAITGDGGFAQTGLSVLIIFVFLLFLLIAIFGRRFLKQIHETGTYNSHDVLLFMILLQAIVHPLIFYIDLSSDWSRASDGQFFMTVGQTFNISSLSFVFIGAIIDLVKHFKLK